MLPLTAQQRKIVDLMRKRAGPIGVLRLVMELYGDDPNGGPLHAEKVIRVQIGRIRKMLGPHGIQIYTVGGEQGYMIHRDDHARLAELLSAEPHIDDTSEVA